MATRRRFTGDTLAAIRDGKILAIRAGSQPHRFIGIWAVVVDGRVFARSWKQKAGGWYQTFVHDPLGAIQKGKPPGSDSGRSCSRDTNP